MDRAESIPPYERPRQLLLEQSRVKYSCQRRGYVSCIQNKAGMAAPSRLKLMTDSRCPALSY